MFWSKQQHRSAWFAVKTLGRATQHDLHVADVKIIINCDEGGFFLHVTNPQICHFYAELLAASQRQADGARLPCGLR